MRLTKGALIRRVPGVTVIEKVAQALVPSKIALPRESLVLAVSGGVDSMVLLEVMHGLAMANDWDLTIAHFNHALRGSASAADEVFVREVAERLALPIVVGCAEEGEIESAQGLSVEMAARKARHRFLAAAARECGSSKVVLAHHAGDQTELFFLRLLRGAGSVGMGGMKLISPSPISSEIKLLRPLLGISKSELMTFARAEGIGFREDESNADSDILRNRVRHKLIPLIESEYSASLSDTVARTMEVLAADHDWVAETAAKWLDSERENPAFERLADAVQREIVRIGLFSLDIVPDFQLIEHLRTSASDSVVMVSGGRRVARSMAGDIVEVPLASTSFRSESCNIELSERQGEQEFGCGRLKWRIEPVKSAEISRPQSPGTECFDADSVGSRIRLRYWVPGDRFQPIGRAEAIKLQDWFTNEKVPANERRERVVAESVDGTLFWIEKMRIGERFKLTESTELILKITWNRDLKN